MLVKKRAVHDAAQCHSAAMFHDYRLRGGLRAAASRTRRDAQELRAVRSSSSASTAPTSTRAASPRKNTSSNAAGGRGAAPHRDARSLGRTRVRRPRRKPPQPLGDAPPRRPAVRGLRGQRRPSAARRARPRQTSSRRPTSTTPTSHRRRSLALYCNVPRVARARARRRAGSQPLSEIVYVRQARRRRPPDRVQDFDVFAPNAELHIARRHDRALSPTPG